MLLLLSNSSILRQAVHSAEASLCTGPTMEEKIQEIAKNAADAVLSGIV